MSIANVVMSYSRILLALGFGRDTAALAGTTEIVPEDPEKDAVPQLPDRRRPVHREVVVGVDEAAEANPGVGRVESAAPPVLVVNIDPGEAESRHSIHAMPAARARIAE